MKLIWTYSSNLQRSNKITKEQILLLYKESIKKGGSYYATSLYTTQKDKGYFEGLVDEIKIIPEGLDYFLDDIKVYVLTQETNNYCLIDGDLMLNAPLIFSDNPVDIETYVDSNYDIWFNKYKDLKGIIDNQAGFYNLGLIAVHNNYWVEGFVDYVEEVKSLYKKKLDTPLGIEVQYLLTKYVEENNIVVGLLNNSSYLHLSGPSTKPKLDYLRSLEKKSLI
jgi:hypothetical protein